MIKENLVDSNVFLRSLMLTIHSSRAAAEALSLSKKAAVAHAILVRRLRPRAM